MLSAKNRNNPISIEAYHVLLGHVLLDKDGKIIPMENSGVPNGPADGAGKLRILGMTHVIKKYKSGKSNTQALYDAGKAFGNIGRGIHFLSRDKVYGCQIRTYILYPVVLAFYENDNGELQLSAYTARSFTSRLAAWLAIRQFDKATKTFLERKEKKKEEKNTGKEKKNEEMAVRKAARDEKKKEARARRKEEREEDREFRKSMKEDERLRLEAMEKDLEEFERKKAGKD